LNKILTHFLNYFQFVLDDRNTLVSRYPKLVIKHFEIFSKNVLYL